MNVGTTDRIIRIALGVALVAWAIGLLPDVVPSTWGWIGIVPLLTGIAGSCLIYALAGVDTCRSNS